MPGGNGTGPSGQGRGTNRGPGAGGKRNQGKRLGAGPVGSCVCPSCGYSMAHKPGTPCLDIQCPKCGQSMRRE